jgi:ACS family tartrate transporter-like MFS transporter
LIEGLPAVVLGFVTLAYLPDGPKHAAWLSLEEKQWIASRLQRERDQMRHHAHHTFGQALRSGRVWTFAFIYFAVIGSFYGISFWLPQIIQAFSGMSDLMVGFLSAIPYIAASIAMVMIGRNSDRSGERRLHVAAAAFTGAAGLTLAAFLKVPAAELAALALAAVGIWSTLGPFWAMSSEFLSGTAAAAGIAVINSVGNLGGFVGPYLVGLVRKQTDSFSLALLVLAVWPLIGGIVALVATRRHHE